MVLERETVGRCAIRGYVGVVGGGRGALAVVGFVVVDDMAEGFFRNLGSAEDDIFELFVELGAVVVDVVDAVIVMTGTFIAQMA